MYRGYKISIDKTLFVEDEIKKIQMSRLSIKKRVRVDNFSKYKNLGESLFSDKIKEADDSLLQYVSDDGVLKGDVIQDIWFPVLEGQFDVFISHSHIEEDLEMAYALSGWLYEKFKLKCFLDEYVWDSADGLIKKLDDLSKRPGKSRYIYRDRNMTTSQVHAMLTSAIMQEIDDCDALFFLNTPNTVDVVTESQEYTLSPWIFLEIGLSRVIKKKWNNEKRHHLATYCVTAEAKQMRMKLDTSHLTELGEDELQDWLDVWNATKQCGNLQEWLKKREEIDPLIILDRQHKLPLKGPRVFLG